MFRFHSSDDVRARARRAHAARQFGCRQDRHYRKRHPLDCGKAGCEVCHGHKAAGDKSLQELRADVDLREGCE